MRNLKNVFIFVILQYCFANEDDYYKVLGIQRSATKAEIKTAFRSLSKKFHPDVSSIPDANEKYTKISEAYEVLADDTKRQKYDKFGKEGLKEMGQGGGGFNGDPFDFFFNQGGQGNFQKEEQKGDPISIKIKASLEDIYKGREINFSIIKKVICSHCRGSGADKPDDVAKCDMCEGRGIFTRRVQVAPGFIQQVQSVCPKCGGKGKTVKSSCHVCKGSKLMTDIDIFNVFIEKGTPHLHKITIHNVGGDYIDKLSSDIVVEIVDKEHSFFKRTNTHNLKAEINLTLKEALLGFSKKVRHLDGHFVFIKESGVTQPNQERLIKGEGLPKHDYPSEKGDLILVFKVVIPDSFTPKQKELWKQFFNA